MTPRAICVERGENCARRGGVIMFEVNDYVALRLRAYRVTDGDERLVRRFFASANECVSDYVALLEQS